MNRPPSVSCICVTHHPIHYLKRSVNCFLNQDYPAKEFVAVFESSNTAASAYLSSLKDERILQIEIPTGTTLSLGQKRNLGILQSSGYYYMTWDDDDWHHPERIDLQMNFIREQKIRSSSLSRITIFDSVAGKGYASGKRTSWEQTLLSERQLWEDGFRYENLERGEDSLLAYNLLQSGLMKSMEALHLYIYVYHGANTWQREHWEKNILPYCTSLQESESMGLLKLINI
jgi:glycosyltransferase involved in cell wall biosynthesis